MAGQAPNMEQFEAYFQRADVDRDGRISGNEAVTFLQASNLPRQVLAQIWMYADQNRVGFLGRSEFYNALKLVTVAQSKRELTPELVKAALYGPASTKIPAPQINLAALSGPPSNAKAAPSPAKLDGSPTSTQGIGVGGLHSFQQGQVMRPPRPPPPSPGFQSQPVVSTQVPGTGSMSVSLRPNAFDSLGGSTDGSQAGISSQVPNRTLTPSATQGGLGPAASSITQPRAPGPTGLLQAASSKPNDSALLSSQAKDSKSLSATGNGFPSDPVFGDVFSAAPTQPQQTSTALSIPASSTGNLSSSRDQPTAKPSAVSGPPATQTQQLQSSEKANHVLPQKSTAFPVAAGQSQPPWPRMTQSDVQKYSKVFVQVDTDRDGKISGEQARNLFLSWRLPREVLKQVWDLSDQDNDSMLSLREFCIALYLMERYREGRPLPTVLPNSAMFDETVFPTSAQPAAGFVNTSWRPTPGFQHPQGTKNVRSIPSAGGKPPRPVPVHQPDEPIQQKAKVPVLEKYLLDQLSTEEQDSLNKKFEEAKDAEKKVADLEKDISEARQKIQFYHAKMQELILYKSRCDNRLNEISERVVGDKREAESLAKKYEEKYKQSGDVASKLTIEEATFRDIQEKKMELYRAIVKLEQDNADGIQDNANKIQSDLEELVKTLNERCKTYGLRGKPTSLVELPFGWQPGIEVAAADWDEAWDKFEDEGFTYVKELTLDVENVIAPPKPKDAFREKVTSELPSSKADDKSELPSSGERLHENNKQNIDNSDQTPRSPPDSPAGVSPSKELQHLRTTKDFNINGSPRATFDTQSEYESVLSGDKGFDEPAWGSFDIHYDTDAAWDFNPVTPKETERERRSETSLFGPDDWGLNPIKTGTQGTDTNLPKQGPFFDSVPSTPLYNSASDWGLNPIKTGTIFDSVPSTPLYNSATSPQADNLFARNSPFAFDSVPSTPMYNSNTSPRRFGEGSEEHYSFDSFSRFDSFNTHDSGPFGSRESFTRFDSMRSSRDSSDFDQGYFGQRESVTRFDSFRSTADSDYNFGQPPPQSLTRFDSMRSTKDTEYGYGFPSFDDPDPFGSSGPFRTSHEAQTPRGDSDGWKAF
ncbi:Synaptic vesicle protein EHS-1 [Handroanthus impetiginosus]|uniref:Synaptic vesicle protein EHS-1 n=1 Tax=Handroanthus impetiginosus TaxID=429701 RepID=A0A2G9I0U9_9LAMI|nr:Synaptic vesicle protein EHS-1 [Handroanthus impetiginosus]